MITKFTIRTYDDNSRRDEVKTTVEATLEAIGITDPRVLVTHIHSSTFEVIAAYDETLTIE